MNHTKIHEAMLEMGMPIRLRGFQYVVSAIELMDKPEWKDPKWTALYTAVGRIHSVTGAAVEKDMRNILKVTRERGHDIDSIDYYIGYGDCTVSNSLTLLYMRLKQSEQEEIEDKLTKLIKQLIEMAGCS